jgi:hypothetical protein
LVAALRVAEEKTPGLYASYSENEKALERAYLDRRDDAGVRLQALEARRAKGYNNSRPPISPSVVTDPPGTDRKAYGKRTSDGLT